MQVRKMLSRRVPLALCCLFAIGAPVALAADEEPVKAKDVYVTSTRVEKELHDVPMSVTVMTADDVRRSTAKTIGELLEDVPGVQIQNDGSQGLKRVSIRGEDAFRTLVLIDGQKVAEHKSMSGVPLLIDPSRIERVEVIKGPASVLYGSDAIGGVINVITKKGGGKPVQGEAAVTYSGASEGFTESLSLYGSSNGFNYRVAGSNTNNGNVRTPIGTMPNTKFKQKDGSAFLSYDFSDKFTAGVSFDYFDGEFNSTDMETVKDPNSNFFVKVPEWTREKYAMFAEGRDLTDWLARVRFDTFYQKTHKEMENFMSQKSMPNMVMDNFANNYVRTTGASLQTDWQLGANNYLIVGYEINYDRLNSDGLTDFSMSMGPISSAYKTTKFYDGNQLTQAVYANMETQLPADFALTYGVRYTHVKSELTRGNEYNTYSKGSQAGQTIPNPTADDSHTNSRPVFNVGVVWTGIENLALRASWAQGFRVPILQELYVDTSMGSMSGVTLANRDLDPETSDNFEIGARYTNNGLNLDWAMFYQLADDYIAAVPTGQGNDKQYTNVAKAKTFGSELAASYDLDCGLTPYASLTWMRRQYDDGEGFKTFDTATPEWVGRYGVRFRHALTDYVDFNADAYLRSQSATKYAEASHEDDYRLGGFTTVNFAVGFDFGDEKQYSVMAEVLNLLDKRYQYNQAILEPGLHANVKVGMKF